jgi:hypothetical protein
MVHLPYLLQDDKEQQTLPTKGNRFSYFFPLGLIGHKVSELLSSIVKVPHGDLGCSWRPRSFVELYNLVVP